MDVFKEIKKEDRFVLSLVGLKLSENGIYISEQGKKQKPFHFIEYENITKLSLVKMEDDRFDIRSILYFFRNFSRLFNPTVHKPETFRLKIHALNNNSKYVFICNLDLPRIKDLLERLNEEFKHNKK